MEVPPRGLTTTEFVLTETPHGWDVTVRVRRLEREPTEDIPIDVLPVFVAWVALGRILRKTGVDVDIIKDDG